MSDADEAFLRFKSQQVLSWTLINMQRLHARPSALCMGRPLEGRTVFVVGAGYSLTESLGYLRTAQTEMNAPIITVNAGDAVLRKAGIRPDALVIRESLIHDDTVSASEAPLIVADIGIHPKTWSAAGDRLSWFFPGYPHLFEITSRLGVGMSYGGSAALTTAVNLVREWGASTIVLVGVDCALTECPDGKWRGYHPDAPRGGMSAGLVEDPRDKDAWLLVQEGNEQDDARATRSGQQAQPQTVRARFVPHSRWGRMLATLDTLEDQRAWLQTQADRHGGNVRLLNASNGAGVVGWEQSDMREVVAELQQADPVVWPARYTVSKATNRAVCEEVTASAKAQATLSEEILSGKPDARRVLPAIAHWSPMAEALSMSRTLDAPEDPRGYLKHTYEAMRAGALETIEILSTEAA